VALTVPSSLAVEGEPKSDETPRGHGQQRARVRVIPSFIRQSSFLRIPLTPSLSPTRRGRGCRNFRPLSLAV
jgi:hypothetical protein